MYTIAPMAEGELTRFHRNCFLISISPLDITPFQDDRGEFYNYFSVEQFQVIYPEATPETILDVVATCVQLKMEKGQRHFLVVYNQQTSEQALQLLSDLKKRFSFEERGVS